MENTNCGCNCAFVKSGFCKTDNECPYFVQTLWQQEGNPNPKLVSDCFPKKFSLEQNQLLHRFLCMQGVLEEQRHRIASLEASIKQLCDVLIKTQMNTNNFILDTKEKLKSLE